VQGNYLRRDDSSNKPRIAGRLYLLNPDVLNIAQAFILNALLRTRMRKLETEKGT